MASPLFLSGCKSAGAKINKQIRSFLFFLFPAAVISVACVPISAKLQTVLRSLCLINNTTKSICLIHETVETWGVFAFKAELQVS